MRARATPSAGCLSACDLLEPQRRPRPPPPRPPPRPPLMRAPPPAREPPAEREADPRWLSRRTCLPPRSTPSSAPLRVPDFEAREPPLVPALLSRAPLLVPDLLSRA